MSENNFVPRLCGFVISSLLSIIVLITSWQSGLVFENNIQLSVIVLWSIWGFILLRSNGWQEYSRKELLLILGGCVYIGLFFTNVWNDGYLNNTPLMSINKTIEGIHRDSLYHSALTQGITNYGYPSLLVNSDEFHNYHVGSHYIFAMLAKILDIPAFFVYCYIFPLLFLPVYPSLILSIGRYLRRYLNLNDRIGLGDLFATMAFITFALLPKGWVDKMAIWKFNWVISESFLVANVVCLLFFYILLRCINLRLFSGKIFKGLFIGLVIPIFILIMSVCKISVGAIFVVAVIYYLIRRYGLRADTIFICLFYASVLLVVHYVPGRYYSPILSATADISNSFSLLHFFLSDVHNGWQIIHFEFFFFYALLFMTWRFKEVILSQKDKNIFKSKKYVVEETLLIVCIIGYLPGNILAIGGGSGFYFAAIQQLYAIVLLIGFNIPQQIYSGVKKCFSSRITVTRNITRFIVVFICCHIIYNTTLYARNISNNVQNSFQQYEESIKENSYWKIINEINSITAGHKKDYYIYISPSASIWKRFKDHDSALFFYPAMTGIVCVGELYFENGILYTNDGCRKDSGYAYKPLTEDKQLIEEAAFEKAKADGKKAVICIYDDTMKVQYIK
ncbi:MAG: hypothetical protein E7197_04890 [Anaerovibrio sp.]|uniref:hypothetical protein n=1 Tax=Anaerovibrio sp. TaxID=1872532 RepID=UPI0025C6D5AE|nr:hypothetical protein [Anaerovibrio sp.]MBE6099372.1 hypothetical protein [Anaerovibrio sp.]